MNEEKYFKLKFYVDIAGLLLKAVFAFTTLFLFHSCTTDLSDYYQKESVAIENEETP